MGPEHLESLRGTRFGDVRWVGTTGSTNSDVLELARDGAPEGVVVVADHQEAGRGRRGRTWSAPPDSSLLVSVLLRPPAPLAPLVMMAVGLAMAEAVEGLCGLAPRLKWPNDLVVAGDAGERKLAGILAETDWPPGATIAGGWRQPTSGERVTVVAGVGINVNWPPPATAAQGPDAMPADVMDGATAVSWEVDRPVDRGDLLVEFLRRLDQWYGAMLQRRSADDVLEAWRDRSATLGRRVRVDLGTTDVEGTAVEVTAEGHLVVDTLEGDRRTLAVGDVVHLRSR